MGINNFGSAASTSSSSLALSIPSVANNANKVLTTDGTAISWSQPAEQLFASATLTGTATTYTFSNIPQTCTNLRIVGQISSSTLTFTVLNGAMLNCYYAYYVNASTWGGGNTGTTAYLGIAGSYANLFDIVVPTYTSSTNKVWKSAGSSGYQAGSPWLASGSITMTAPVTSITFTSSAVMTGTISVYGML